MIVVVDRRTGEIEKVSDRVSENFVVPVDESHFMHFYVPLDSLILPAVEKADGSIFTPLDESVYPDAEWSSRFDDQGCSGSVDVSQPYHIVSCIDGSWSDEESKPLVAFDRYVIEQESRSSSDGQCAVTTVMSPMLATTRDRVVVHGLDDRCSPEDAAEFAYRHL